MMGGAAVPTVPLVCTAPVRYQGEAAPRRDIENLQAALAGVEHRAAFMPAGRRAASEPTSTIAATKSSSMRWRQRLPSSTAPSSPPAS
jgi:hypothetical protein